MRLSIVSYSGRKIGGAEHNLDVVLPELERRGHTLQFLYFHDDPPARESVRTSAATERIHVGQTGPSQALVRLRAFRPDLINVHGEVAPAFQASLLPIAPAAYSVHNYYGTCISGLKTNAFPVIQPCSRTFGAGCLLRYFPRRCGGRNPLTALRRYRVEQARLRVMQSYDAVITHTQHMQDEYQRHGLRPERIHGLPYEVTTQVASGYPAEPSSAAGPVRLAFVGRMEKLKGGQVLLSALTGVQHALKRPVELEMAGDGPAREEWQRRAQEAMARHAGIAVRFPGWLTGPDLQDLFRRSHLLVVPSLWPEPFGKVGCEAGGYGLPVAAFAVGGIEEWLLPGINGELAPGNPPRATGLATAIVSCLADPARYARLRQGALANVQRFNLRAHVDSLVDLFEKVCRERNGLAAGATS